MEPQNDYSHGRSALVRTLARDSGGMEEKTLFDHLLSEWLIVPSAEMMMSGPV